MAGRKNARERLYFWNAFFAAFSLLTLSVLFVVLYFNPNVRPAESPEPQNVMEPADLQIEYTPDSRDNLTVLLVVERAQEDLFALVRMQVEEQAVRVYLIPERFSFMRQPMPVTAGEAYDYAGVRNLQQMIAQEYGFSVDRYIRVPQGELEAVLDQLGMVRLEVTSDLSFQSGGRQVTYTQGAYRLSGRQLSELFAATDYDDSKTVLLSGGTLCSLLEQKLPLAFGEQGEALFSQLMNSVDSDFSLLDFKEHLQPLQWIFRENRRPVEYFLLDNSQ